MKLRKPSRGKNSRNRKAINAAVSHFLQLPAAQRPHGTQKRIAAQFGVRVTSFSSALKRAESLLAQTS